MRIIPYSICLPILLLAIGCATRIPTTLPGRDPRPASEDSARVQASPTRAFNALDLNEIAVIIESEPMGIAEVAVEDEATAVLFEKGYRVTPRSDINRVLEEQRFQRSRLAEPQLKRIGEILSATALLLIKPAGMESPFLEGKV